MIFDRKPDFSKINWKWGKNVAIEAYITSCGGFVPEGTNDGVIFLPGVKVE